MTQVADEQLTETLDAEMNSIAQTVKHMAGNMRSRWTDFLNTDGEKPDRNRDSEFVGAPGVVGKRLAVYVRCTGALGGSGFGAYGSDPR